MLKLAQKKDMIIAMSIVKRKRYLSRHNVCSITPAIEQKDAMYIGNGELRARILGNPYKEVITFDHEMLYVPEINDKPVPPPLADELDTIRRMLLDGKGSEVAKLISDIARKSPFYSNYLRKVPDNQLEIPISIYRYFSAAQLTITGLTDSTEQEISEYIRTTDYLTGETKTHWKTALAECENRSFISTEDNVFIMEVSKNGNIDNKITLGSIQQWKAHNWEQNVIPEKVTFSTGIEGNMLYAEGRYDDYGIQKGYRLSVKVENAEEVYPVIINDHEVEIQVKAAEAYRIIAVFNYYAPMELEDRDDAAIISKYTDTEYNELLKDKTLKLSECMKNSILETAGDDYLLSTEEILIKQHAKSGIQPAFIEKFYDAGRYFQITNTGKLPPLIGQWNINVNLQVCGGNQTLLPEQMMRFFDYFEDKMEDYRTNAKEMFGCRGILTSVHPDVFTGIAYHFSRTWPHSCWTACAGWVYNEYWNYYLVTGDIEFLKKRVYPGLREVALFYSDFLKDKDADGNYLFYPCFSPENNPMGENGITINAVMDIMVCKEVMEHLLEAEEILQIADDEHNKWKDILEHLPILLRDEEGGLKEWAYANYAENYDHRHVSHHYSVWPGHDVSNEDTPELANAIQISNRKRGTQDYSAHGYMHRIFTAIRLGDMEYAGECIRFLLEKGYVNRTLQTNHFPYRVFFPDVLGGIPAVISELILYSKPGYIKLLPGYQLLPSQGSISALAAYTFLRVNQLTWDKNELSAEIYSIKDQTILIQLPEFIRECKIENDEVKLEKKTLKVVLSAGQSIHIRCK